jgi:GNAT superfamily N-acetyltransferase
MNLMIREANKNDLSSIISLYSQPSMDNGQVLLLNEAQIVFERTRNYPFYKVYVAILDEEIVGAFELLIMDNLAHRGMPSAIIEDVAVAEEHQSKGVGRAMLQYAMKICKEMGCYKAALSSNLKREQAHEFYESLGFQKHGYSFWVEL